MSKTDSSKVVAKVGKKSILTNILIIIGCIGVTIAALMFTGVLIPFLPIISTMCSMFLTGNLHFFILWSLISTLLLYVALRCGAGSKTKKFFWVGSYAAIGCLLVLGVHSIPMHSKTA